MPPKKKTAAETQPMTLAIDIGGTGLKASVLDPAGNMMAERVHVATPDPGTPHVMVDALVGLVAPLPAYDRISVGFPGVVRRGVVVTAPHFGNDIWHGFPLSEALAKRLGHPVRLLNDAEVQGLGVIKRQGLEVVLTLGTSVGSAIFSSGRLTPHLELAHHPIRGNKTYGEYLGNDAKHAIGDKKWNKRVKRMIDIVQVLVNYDTLYIGGGNAQHVSLKLPPNVHLSSNEAGITGGIHLWDDEVWSEAT